MSEGSSTDVTQLLRDWSAGNRAALDELFPIVYSDLHRLSRHYLRRRGPYRTLQTNELINEAFVRLIEQEKITWKTPAQFLGIAARTMRNILADRARRHQAQKRGAGARDLVFDEGAGAVRREKGGSLLALEDALSSLLTVDPKLGRLVEMRYFAGMSVRETAQALGISPATVNRGLRTARSWLLRELGGRQKQRMSKALRA